jgi:hypothetical protein
MIELADIPAAVANYLDTNVTTSISTVTPRNKRQAVLAPGQDGTFTVTVQNAPPPGGIRPINVKYHVKISDDTVARLVVPRSALLAAYDNLGSTSRLTAGTRRSEMFVQSLADTTLDLDDTDSFPPSVSPDHPRLEAVRAWRTPVSISMTRTPSHPPFPRTTPGWRR